MTYTYEQIHAERYRISMEWISGIDADKVLEVGAKDGFSARLGEIYKDITNTGFDLRFASGWRSLEQNSFDLVVCMELLEHINEPIKRDSPISEIAEFSGNGVRNALDGMFRCLKPGGHLFLTTPNGASVENIRRALNGHTPIQYMPHVREHGPQEVVSYLTGAGFSIDRIDFYSCYMKFCTQKELEERNEIKALLKDRWGAIMRGETTFIMARKP